MTKRIIIFLILIFLSEILLFSQDSRVIEIVYKHSTRILDNTIFIKMDNTINVIIVKVYQIKGRKIVKQYKKLINIDEEYFNSIYERLMKINYTDIIDKGIDGLDGHTIEIKIGSFMTISIWTPNYDFEKRGTKELLALLIEIFTKIGLESKLN